MVGPTLCGKAGGLVQGVLFYVDQKGLIHLLCVTTPYYLTSIPKTFSASKGKIDGKKTNVEKNIMKNETTTNLM